VAPRKRGVEKRENGEEGVLRDLKFHGL